MCYGGWNKLSFIPKFNIQHKMILASQSDSDQKLLITLK